MKKTITLLLAFAMLFSLAACGRERPPVQDMESHSVVNEEPSTNAPSSNVEIKTSPDKYTWYIKNYVGKNMASIGYTSMGGDRMDTYGNAYIRLALVATNGDYVDIENEEVLKNWVVVAQNVFPNTELKLTYQLDSDGNEYDNLISHQSIEEILLAVAPIGENADIPALTTINVSPDRYTAYIYDYVGRTLAQCGYVSMAGKLMQQYGSAYVNLAVYAEDGSYVDIQNSDSLKNYVVTRQSVAPNTELKMVYSKDSDGNEYDNLIDTQNIEEIELYVVLVNSYTAQPNEADDPVDNTIAETEGDEELVDGMRPEFKEAMDAYEAFYDEYCAFMAEYKENPSDMTLLLKYSEMMTKVVEMDEAFTKWDDEDLNSEELKYYLEVNNRVMQKLIDVAG